MRPVRIGIVGCGNVMDGAYMPVIERLQQQGKVQVIGATHSSRARCRALLKKWRIPAYFECYQELCHSPQVDLVLVLTPMQQHAAIAREALIARKHVLVEKPLATTLPEARQLIAAARQARRLLVCAPFVILSPTFGMLRQRLTAGDIGKVSLARARYGWAGPDWSEWFYQRGGGPIFDLAVYSITSLTGLLGSARRVMAMTGRSVPTRKVRGRSIRVEVEDNAQLMLDFGRGMFAVITSGFTMQKYRSPALEFYGSSGTLQMLGDDWAPDGYELWQNRLGAWQNYGETDPHWQWTQGLVHLVDCIANGTRPRTRPEHAYHVLEIMLAAQASGRTGRAQRIKSRFVMPLPSAAASQPSNAHRVHNRPRADD